jgi:hypothetical protein
MDLQVPALEPDSAPLLEIRGLRNIGNAEESEVELARTVLSAARHRKLDMVDPDDPHPVHREAVTTEWTRRSIGGPRRVRSR